MKLTSTLIDCEVCQRKTNALDLEKVQISIFHEGWACDTCRKEIKENVFPDTHDQELENRLNPLPPDYQLDN